MQKLKISDEVIVLSGRNKGKKGKVFKLLPKRNRVLIEGVNLLKKNMKPTQENPSGGIIDKEASIHISNVAIVSPKTNKGSRVRIETRDGKNVRIAVACGSVLK